MRIITKINRRKADKQTLEITFTLYPTLYEVKAVAHDALPYPLKIIRHLRFEARKILIKKVESGLEKFKRRMRIYGA